MNEKCTVIRWIIGNTLKLKNAVDSCGWKCDPKNLALCLFISRVNFQMQALFSALLIPYQIRKQIQCSAVVKHCV